MADFESDLQIDGKSIYSLRVIDLKQELKKRDIAFKTNATKAQLQTLLIEHLNQSIDTIEEDKLSEDNSHTTEQSEDTNETIKSNSEININTVEDNKPIAEQTEATDLSQDSGITSSVSFGDKQSIKLTIKLQPNDSPTKQMSPKKSPTKEMRSPVPLEEVRKDIEEKPIKPIDSHVEELTQISSEDKTKDLDQKEINSLESKTKEETVVRISEEISVETEKQIKSIDSEPKEENEKQIEQEFNEKDNKCIDSEVKDETVSQREDKSNEKEKSIELEEKEQTLDPIKEKSTENEIKSLDVKVNEKRVEQINDKSIEKDNKSIESEVKDEKVSQKVEKTIEKEKSMESQPKEETTDPIKSTEKENKSIESKAKEEKAKPPRRRRWGSSVTTTDSQNARKGISSDQLKELIPDLNSSDNSSSALKVSKSDSIVVTSSLSRTQTTEENNEIPTKRDIRVVRKSVSVAEEEQTITEETTSQPIVEQKTKIVVEMEPESKGDTELKREVSPPRSAESNILFIRNLVRPFTLLQLKELLRKTGKLNVDRFWIDNIKSKCYATYETVEEAVATRTALHGTRWPSSNPKLLSVDFAKVEDLDSYLNPELNKELNNRKSDNDLNQKYDIVVRTEEQRNVLREKENKNESRPIREWDREKLVNKEDERKGRRRPNSPTNRSKSREQDTKRRKIGEERVRPADSTSEEAPPTAEAVKRTESPAKLLDDLFKKTSATPSIYWLPLTEEQAIARLAVREEEEKKRTEERNAREEQFRKRQEERRPFDGPSPPFRNDRNQWRNDGPSNRGGFGGRRGSPRRSPFGGRRSPPRRRSPVNRFSRSRSRSPFARRKR